MKFLNEINDNVKRKDELEKEVILLVETVEHHRSFSILSELEINPQGGVEWEPQPEYAGRRGVARDVGPGIQRRYERTGKRGVVLRGEEQTSPKKGHIVIVRDQTGRQQASVIDVVSGERARLINPNLNFQRIVNLRTLEPANDDLAQRIERKYPGRKVWMAS